MNNIKLSSIVAIAKNYVIGKDNTLIWHISEDLKHFKRTTLGKPIIMGRKSYDSLGKPLPGRPNIVVSRAYQSLDTKSTPHFSAMESVEVREKPTVNAGPFLYGSIEDGIAAAKKMATEMAVDEVFITGGGEIYKQTMPLVDRIYLTIVHREYEGDTVFPEFNWDEWDITAEDHHETEGNTPAFTFFTLDRKA